MTDRTWRRGHQGEAERGAKGWVSESLVSNMCFLFRPKFWENLTSPLFGTLSPPSETSEVSCGAGGPGTGRPDCEAEL